MGVMLGPQIVEGNKVEALLNGDQIFPAMLKAIRGGDKVMTSSGIIGVVITVKEKSVTLRSADSKFEVAKSAIAEITERGGESSES